jgi:hypothetical protein
MTDGHDRSSRYAAIRPINAARASFRAVTTGARSVPSFMTLASCKLVPMKIRREQIQELSEARVQQFEASVIKELRENFPEHLDDADDESLLEFVQSVEEDAMNYGLETGDQIRRLAVYSLGAEIFLDDVPDWFAGIMSQTTVSAQNRIRMLALRLAHEMSEVLAQ